MKVRLKLHKNTVADSPAPPTDEPVLSPINYETTVEFLNSVWGHITRHGIKVMSDGRQWVINSMTGEAMERKDATPIKDPKDNIFWIGKGQKLSPLDRPTFYTWKNP